MVFVALPLVPDAVLVLALFLDIPQGNRLDLVQFDLPLQNLLDLTLVWTLLHLLTSNQVQELRSEDEITLHSLRNNKKSQTGSGCSADK